MSRQWITYGDQRDNSNLVFYSGVTGRTEQSLNFLEFGKGFG